MYRKHAEPTIYRVKYQTFLCLYHLHNHLDHFLLLSFFGLEQSTGIEIRTGLILIDMNKERDFPSCPFDFYKPFHVKNVHIQLNGATSQTILVSAKISLTFSQAIIFKEP